MNADESRDEESARFAVGRALDRFVDWLPGTTARRSERASDPQTTVANVEAVRDLLAANGGRLYQSDVVAARTWSPSTVSRTLSEMEAREEIVRIRDGRKKVVCTPERVPDDHHPDARE